MRRRPEKIVGIWPIVAIIVGGHVQVVGIVQLKRGAILNQFRTRSGLELTEKCTHRASFFSAA